MLDRMSGSRDQNTRDESGEMKALQNFLLHMISMIEEIEYSLQQDFSAEALWSLSRQFENISKEFTELTMYKTSPSYLIIRRSELRLRSAKNIAQQAGKISLLFERYAKKPVSYRRGHSSLEIHKLVIELKNLAAFTGLSPEDSTSTSSLRESTKSSRQVGTASRPVIKMLPDEPSGSQLDDTSDEVSFTAFHPKEGKVGAWYTLLVYAHLMSAMDDVYRDTGRFSDQLGVRKEIGLNSATRLARGTKITIVPSCKGILFNPQDTYITWQENYHRLNFRFRADPSLINDAAKGNITVYVGPLIVATLNFAIIFSGKDEAASVIQEEQTTMYHRDKIFISYSHKDKDLISIFEKVHEATGFDVLIDKGLKSGQAWNAELMRMIDRADIFQLFWSQNSCQSKYCRQEWQHALERKQEGFIRPVYWQEPLPDPPDELSKYHFARVTLQA